MSNFRCGVDTLTSVRRIPVLAPAEILAVYLNAHLRRNCLHHAPLSRLAAYLLATHAVVGLLVVTDEKSTLSVLRWYGIVGFNVLLDTL